MELPNRLASLGLGMALTYYFDPQLGHRRRILLRDQVAHAGRRLLRFTDIALRDLEHRLQGMAAETVALFRVDRPSEARLKARVRTRLGHVTPHAHHIEVAVHNGHVRLQGAVESDEAPEVLHAVSAVRGVTEVENHLEVQPGDKSSASRQRRLRNLSPAARLLGGMTGMVLMIRCMARPTMTNVVLGTVGFGLFLRSALEMPRYEQTVKRTTRQQELVKA